MRTQGAEILGSNAFWHTFTICFGAAITDSQHLEIKKLHMHTVSIWQVKDSWTRLKIFLCSGSSKVSGIKSIFSTVKSRLLTPTADTPTLFYHSETVMLYISRRPTGIQKYFQKYCSICAGVERHFSRAKVNFMNDPWAFVCSALLHRKGQGQHWHLLIRVRYIHSLAIAEKRDALCICRSGWFSHIFLFYFCSFRHLSKSFQALHLFNIQLDASCS